MKLCFLLFLLILLAVNFSAVAGASCSCNCNCGDETCSKTPDTSHKSIYVPNIKQCAFEKINSDKDSGQIKTCQFAKAKSSTSLRVTFQGDLRVIGCSGGCCHRWFITINGKECTSPAAIDAVVLDDRSANRHAPGTLDGFCDNIPKGNVTVGLSIGGCTSHKKGDAYTGFDSVSRFIIEEVPPLQ